MDNISTANITLHAFSPGFTSYPNCSDNCTMPNIRELMLDREQQWQWEWENNIQGVTVACTVCLIVVIKLLHTCISVIRGPTLRQHYHIKKKIPDEFTV